jgi:hypothetical protein
MSLLKVVVARDLTPMYRHKIPNPRAFTLYKTSWPGGTKISNSGEILILWTSQNGIGNGQDFLE